MDVYKCFTMVPCRMFNFGEFKSEDQDSLIDELNKKVEEVYRACVGDNKANIKYARTRTLN